jgi:hypothetical protein
LPIFKLIGSRDESLLNSSCLFNTPIPTFPRGKEIFSPVGEIRKGVEGKESKVASISSIITVEQ